MKNNIVDIKRVETNNGEPITLTQAKAHLIVTSTDDDTIIGTLLTQARRAVENYCNVSIVTYQITLIADLYNEWELPYGPVSGILSVQTRQGTQGSGPATYQTATSNWSTEGEEFLSFSPAGGSPLAYWNLQPNQWPQNMLRSGFNYRYKIVYTTGPYVPEDLLLAILNETAYRYLNRGEETITGICEAARILADPYKRLAWL